MRQGRGPELTGRLAGARVGWWVSVRAGLKEAVDVSWSRTRVKRRKASLGGRAGRRQRCPVPVGAGGRIGDGITTKILGFSLRLDPQDGTVEVLLSERTKRNAMARIRQLTPRNWGGSLDRRITRINVWLRGWHQFFGVASAGEEYTLRALDAHIRRRLRAIVLRHWKRRATIARNLVALGVRRHAAWRGVYAGRKSWWALSHEPVVDRGLRNTFFAQRGLNALVVLHRRAHEDIVAPAQPQLVLEWG